MENKKSIKISLIAWTVFAVIVYAFSIIMIIGGTKVANDDLVVVGALLLILFSVLFIWEMISLFLKLKKSKNLDKYNEIAKDLLKIGDQYEQINLSDFDQENTVCFINEKLKFLAEAKFVCVENFNDKAGYHFAFNIKGTKLIEKPDNYEDVVGYEECLFNINLAYFDGIPLAVPENQCGIKVRTLENLKGKVVKFDSEQGYIASIDTAEVDEIDWGQIRFEEWTETSKIISFKFVVGAGVNDIVVGRVNLEPDKYEG